MCSFVTEGHGHLSRDFKNGIGRGEEQTQTGTSSPALSKTGRVSRTKCNFEKPDGSKSGWKQGGVRYRLGKWGILEDKGEDFEIGRTHISLWELVLDGVLHGHMCILWVWERFGWARPENCMKTLPIESLFLSIHWWVMRGQESWEKIAWFTIKRLGLVSGRSSVVEHVFGMWVPGLNPQHQNKNKNEQNATCILISAW